MLRVLGTSNWLEDGVVDCSMAAIAYESRKAQTSICSQRRKAASLSSPDEATRCRLHTFCQTYDRLQSTNAHKYCLTPPEPVSRWHCLCSNSRSRVRRYALLKRPWPLRHKFAFAGRGMNVNSLVQPITTQDQKLGTLQVCRVP